MRGSQSRGNQQRTRREKARRQAEEIAGEAARVLGADLYSAGCTSQERAG